MHFIGFGAMDVTKPHKFIHFGDIHGPELYKFIGFRWVFISQTPVVLRPGSRFSGQDVGRMGPAPGYRKAVWPDFLGATKWP